MNINPNYNVGQPGDSLRKETLQGTLINAAQCLGECEAMLREISNKLNGESPQKPPSVEASMNGVNSVALEIRNRAQQIRSLLGELSSEIA
jgi:hypothetical protein